LGVTVITFYWLKATYIEEVEKNLSQNIDSFSIALVHLNDLDAQVQALKKRTQLRITIIDETGVVIAESDKDKSTMDNHINREEIVNINAQGVGKIIRKSDTVNKEMLNVVKKVTIDNQLIYIRMGDYLTHVESRFMNLTLQISSIFAIFLLFTLLIIYIISNRLQIQTDKILLFLTKLSKKDGLNKSNLKSLNVSYTLEFYQISKLLRKVALKLSKKEKLKSKHTAKLKLANQQKDEIISAISHEFKNPIAIIAGYTETILTDNNLPLNMRESFLKKIYSNANKMSALIDRLRLSLKLEENKQEGFFKPCSMKKICQEIIGDLKQKYKNREIVIEGEDITLNVDETLMSIAIGNLIENALKYSDDKVTVELTEKDIKVIDMGIGIDTKDLEKIKNKFYRVSKNNWNNSLGLGLFIVLKILRIHHFDLQIESELNFGSKFIIKFK
jgi:signal transduction histidine kinase